MKCFVNWIPVNTHVRLNKSQPYFKWKRPEGTTARGSGRSIEWCKYECNFPVQNWANMKHNALCCSKQDESKLWFTSDLLWPYVNITPPGPGLFFCLLVGIKTEKLYSASCWEGSKPPGSDHTRAEAQTTCIPTTAVQTTYVSIYG